MALRKNAHNSSICWRLLLFICSTISRSGVCTIVAMFVLVGCTLDGNEIRGRITYVFLFGMELLVQNRWEDSPQKDL
jgi:hypothetical protein